MFAPTANLIKRPSLATKGSGVSIQVWFDDADVAAVVNKGWRAVDIGILAYKYAVFKRCGYWVAEVAAENDLGLELKWE